MNVCTLTTNARLSRLSGAAAWLRAKVGLFPIDIQFEQSGDIYEMIVKVTYRPLPPIPEIVYERHEP